MKAEDVVKDLKAIANPTKAAFVAGYFKTGKGEYGHGDAFLGITVPEQRKIAKKYKDIGFGEVEKLIKSNIHEHRFTALEILVFQFEKANEPHKKEIVDFYLKYRKGVNNWDLVDTSAPYILGKWLLDKDRSILYKLAESDSLWDRRIAIISTFAFIKVGEFKDTLQLAEKLLFDNHDLIHKAVGWMLRELGKQSENELEHFLKKNSNVMPRTMLRYAIERLSEQKKKMYLSVKRK